MEVDFLGLAFFFLVLFLTGEGMSELIEFNDELMHSEGLFIPSVGLPFGVLVKGCPSSCSDGFELDSGSDSDLVASEDSSSDSSSSSETGQSSSMD